MMFHLHPSHTLQDLFRRRPYQGATPEDAKFLFIGLDANFDEKVETKAVFREIAAYLEDGVHYWRSRGFHHPFLHPEYRGAGRRYHLRFAEIGFSAQQAPSVSFVELVDVPTFGQSNLELRDLNGEHLARLDRWLFSGNGKQVFMFNKVYHLLRRVPQFRRRLPPAPIGTVGSFPLRLLYRNNETSIFATTHFSHYGSGYTKADRVRQMADIRALIY